MESYLASVGRHGFKVRIKLKSGQQVLKFSFEGIAGVIDLVPDPAVSRELRGIFRADPGERWLGFVSPPGAQRKPYVERRKIVCYKYHLVIKPVRAKPQPIAIVVQLQDRSFRTHYLLDVRILATAPRTITTAVNAVFDRRRPTRRTR